MLSYRDMTFIVAVMLSFLGESPAAKIAGTLGWIAVLAIAYADERKAA